MGTAVGGSLTLYKFDEASVAADNGTTVLKPINPEFDDDGRWLSVLSGSGGGSSATFLSGHGDPNGAQPGEVQGQTYVDLDTGGLWVFTGTVGDDTGWV